MLELNTKSPANISDIEAELTAIPDCCRNIVRPNGIGFTLSSSSLDFILHASENFEGLKTLLAKISGLRLLKALKLKTEDRADAVYANLKQELKAVRINTKSAPKECEHLLAHLKNAQEALTAAIGFLVGDDKNCEKALKFAISELERAEALLPNSDLINRSDACCAPTDFSNLIKQKQ